MAAGSAAALLALAVFNHVAARRAERRQPPIGDFVDIDGTRLHYIDKGDGPAVVLIHGTGAVMQDMILSLGHGLTRRHRVVIFDRPGYGYSERPRDRYWPADAQAQLIRAAVRRLGLDRPVIVGHSFGATVALSYALEFPAEIRGAALLSGYYFPTARPDFAIMGAPALPVVGWAMRNTVSPILARILAPYFVAKIFAPNAPPPHFAAFPMSLDFRPGQIRAVAEDSALLHPWAKRFQDRYGAVRVPVSIVAGGDDRIVDAHRHSAALHDAIPHSALRLLPGVGHMVHHVDPAAVIAAIDALFDAADRLDAADRRSDAAALMPAP